jgi:hypothetical protein
MIFCVAWGDATRIFVGSWPKMLWKGTAYAAAMVLLSVAAAHAAASSTVPASVVVSKAAFSESPYSGSPCEGDGYAGQCASGNCQCISVSGDFCTTRIRSKANKDKDCAIAISIDDGLATGTGGCSPIFGVLKGFSSDNTVAIELSFNGTSCPTKGLNLGGAWVLDSATSYSQGEGLLTGSLGSALRLTLRGELTPN